MLIVNWELVLENQACSIRNPQKTIITDYNRMTLQYFAFSTLLEVMKVDLKHINIHLCD